MGYLGTKPANAAITSEQIADGVVSTADLANSAVTTAKIADANVTTAKVADASITAAKMAAGGAWAPAGTVLQVVNATLTSLFTTTSGSFVTTGLTASITPRFSTSKIFVLVSTYGLGLSGAQANFTIYRNSTNLASGSGANQNFVQMTAGGSISLQSSVNIAMQDSPATTSSTTYTLYACSTTAGNTTYINNSSGTSTITLMEIAG